jgi:hypothetical protein
LILISIWLLFVFEAADCLRFWVAQRFGAAIRISQEGGFSH